AAATMLRGNGGLLAPAWLLAVWTARRCDDPPPDAAPRIGWLFRSFLTAAWVAVLFTPTALWTLRCQTTDYPGIHGSGYLEELLAAHPSDVWKRVSRIDAEPIPQATAADFARRFYKNFAWGQVVNYPAAAYPPAAWLFAGLDRRDAPSALTWAAALPFWIVLGVGAARALRSASPSLRLAAWYLLLNAVLLLAWPWPWGAHPRFLLPFTPIVTLFAVLGLSACLRLGTVRGLLALAVAMGGVGSAVQALRQSVDPYATPDVADVVALVRRAAADPGFRAAPTAVLSLDPSLADLAYLLTDRQATPVLEAVDLVRRGKAPAAYIVAGPTAPALAENVRRLTADPAPETPSTWRWTVVAESGRT
ncbi:MAG: hypothetical protein ACRDD1_07990, partial [Planctomycetia bacterium]